MKILLITVRSDLGGGPRHMQQLISSLPEDINIFVACPLDGNPYGKWWHENKRIKGVYDIPFRKFSIRALWGLRAFILSNQIEIIHSHGNGAGFYSRLLKIICSQNKVVHTFHGVSTNYSSAFKAFIVKGINRFFSHYTDAFICVSKGEKQIASEYGYLVESIAYVIYNGIPSQTINKKIDLAFTIVTLSRFDYQKNMDLCFKIARRFKANDKIRFVWVGDGPDYDRLKRQAFDENLQIEFVGFSNEVMKYLVSSSIYLSTSRFEGLPYALLEAMSIGLPIVASDVVGNNEAVIHNRTGFLFKTDNDAYTYINRLYNDKTLLSNMSEESLIFFKTQFEEETMITSLVDVYKDLIDEKMLCKYL